MLMRTLPMKDYSCSYVSQEKLGLTINELNQQYKQNKEAL